MALVAGTDFATVERAITGGARAAVLDQPGGLSLEEVMVVGDLADQHDCIVVPAPRYAPRLTAAPDLVDAANIDLVRAPSSRRKRLARSWSNSWRSCARCSAR